MMVHSVYSDKTVFLRELISNAADACEKLRYEALSAPELLGDETRLAIAITLPVVELHAPGPDEGDLAAAYLTLAPEYAAYGLSVIFIGLYWAHSHFSGKLLEKTDHGYNLLSIGFLAAVSITPFPARPLIEHLSGDADSRTATLVYLGIAAAPATW